MVFSLEKANAWEYSNYLCGTGVAIAVTVLTMFLCAERRIEDAQENQDHVSKERKLSEDKEVSSSTRSAARVDKEKISAVEVAMFLSAGE
ncbi:hypothetical protein Q1695_014359 [Nippostrongylus brasiliensis]|nr:hypothetical protein Q1695_014359 [Nippostrongylus brasiliensis]